MSNESPQTIGPYEIVEPLGRGGLTTVYKAVQKPTRRTVALKVLRLDPESPQVSAERFQRETQAVAMLDHPNIVKILDRGEEDGRLYYAMEYVPGGSLGELMQQRRLSFAEALRVFKEVCKGLAFAHRHKIIHRDLNPGNILVSPDLSTVKLAGFGICRIEALSEEAGTLSTSQISLGTLHYMAPEQAANMASTDHRSDIFSLGVLFYEMLTGKVPVGRFSLPSRINGEVPPQLDPIVLKCLATDPNARYQSVLQLLNAVKRLEETLRLRLVDELKGISRSTGKIFRRSTQPFNRKGSLVGLAVAAGLIAISALAYVAYSSGWISSSGGPADLAGANASQEAQAAAAPPGNEVNALGKAAEEPQAVPAQPSLTEPIPASPEVKTPPSVSQDGTPAPIAPAATPADRATGAEASALEDVRTQFRQGHSGQALSEVEALLASEPPASLAAEALLLKGQILEKLEREEEAAATYSELTSGYPGHPEALEAMFRQAELIRSARQPGWEQQALRLFSEVGEKGPAGLAAPALLRAGEIQGILKEKVQDPELNAEVPATLVTYRRLIREYPEAPAAEFACWSLGNQYTNLGEHRLAAEVFEQLGTRFPNTRWDAWWQAAELYEKLKDDVKAQEAYARVPPGSRNYEKAQKRLQRATP